MVGYANLNEVYKDIPTIAETDKDNISRYDDEIKADIDSRVGGYVTLPYSTTPTQIKNAATTGVEYLYFIKTNEIDRANALLKRYESMIAAYIADLQKQRNAPLGKIKVVSSGYKTDPRSNE